MELYLLLQALFGVTIFNIFHLVAHKLLTKILQHTKIILHFLPICPPQIGMILIHSHQTAIVVLAAVIFYFQSKGKEVRYCMF